MHRHARRSPRCSSPALEHPDFSTFDLSHIRTGIMAGSPCPIKVMQDVVDKMHMSEITIVLWPDRGHPPAARRQGRTTAWRRGCRLSEESFPAWNARLSYPQTYAELKPGQIGEFVAPWIQHHEGILQYAGSYCGCHRQGRLAAYWRPLQPRTKDGYYKITGRLKDMIIRGGENIYPMEIEEFLYSPSRHQGCPGGGRSGQDIRRRGLCGDCT